MKIDKLHNKCRCGRKKCIRSKRCKFCLREGRRRNLSRAYKLKNGKLVSRNIT